MCKNHPFYSRGKKQVNKCSADDFLFLTLVVLLERDKHCTLQEHANAVQKDSKTMFSCPKCNLKTQWRSRLLLHIKAVHCNIKQFSCDQCDLKTAYKHTLQAHVEAVHNHVKQFSCELCDFQTAYNLSLKKHTRGVHEKIKDIYCLPNLWLQDCFKSKIGREKVESGRPHQECSWQDKTIKMFSLVEPLLRFISLPPIKVENILLVCHYRVTPVYMLLVAIILTSKVTLVDNINCHPRYGSSTDISVNTLQVHCYYNHDSHSGVPPFYQFLPLLFFISALGFTAPKVIYQMFEKSIFEEIIGDLSKPFKVKHDFKPVSQAFTAFSIHNLKLRITSSVHAWLRVG